MSAVAFHVEHAAGCDPVIPRLVLDLETTGFPNNGAGFSGRVIELGAVVITEDARIVSPIAFFVKQPRAHLQSWQARRAMGVHGIGVERVLREGLEPSAAADRFETWVAKVRARFGVEQVVAYNQGFDFWFLERPPWRLFERTGLVKGEDVQLCARRTMGRKSGPSLKKAVAFANQAGADIPWLGAAHRAGEDARMAAKMALFFGAYGAD